MSATTEPTRRPGLDNEADGLDCFESEAVAVIDTADDADVFLEEAIPPVAMGGVRDFWQRARGHRYVLKYAVFVVIPMMLVTAVEILREPVRPAPGEADARSTRAPAAQPLVATAPPPSVPLTESKPAPIVESRETTPEVVVAVPPRVPVAVPVPRAIAPREARATAATALTDAASRPVVPLSAAIENPIVSAPPAVVRAEPAPEAPRAVPVAAIITPPSDRVSIERVLEQYRDAYDRLDAPSAAVIWPRVDTRALSRAFSTLAEQDLSFDSCDLDIAGAQAKARCVGEIRYVRRVGDPAPRVRRLSWSFALERVSDRWQIAQVTAN
jgi:hypothetical protein